MKQLQSLNLSNNQIKAITIGSGGIGIISSITNNPSSSSNVLDNHLFNLKFLSSLNLSHNLLSSLPKGKCLFVSILFTHFL